MSTLEEKAIEIAKRQILEKLAAEEPWIFGEHGIYHVAKTMKNGELQFTVRVYEGSVTDLVTTEVKRYTYKKK